MGDQLWLKAAERIARGAEPGRALVAGQEERKRRGLTGTPACAVIARSATASVWHTESTAVNDLPWWRPAFGGSRAEGLYRGFDREALGTVLQTGLDVPAQSSFFASDFPDKAWEYPTGRTQRYLDGSREIHTRFEVGHGTRRFRDENMYGFWVPGDARDALIAVVLGGPRESVLQGLHDVSRHVELDFA
jgi:hypothetical protein